jgi:uncharacterized protein (TIGR02757 family)
MTKVNFPQNFSRRMKKSELKQFLDEQWQRYEHPQFVADDPIAIPKQFYRKEDIEISGFLVATIAWGKRTSIMNSARALMHRMDHHPYGFILEASDHELRQLEGFVHRTFNDSDLLYFAAALREIYLRNGGLEALFTAAFRQDGRAATAIQAFRTTFFQLAHPERTQKHVANPARGSSAKRINMFLRWMVRPSDRGVDFGLWQGIQPAWLEVPLDVHTGTVARTLGLLRRKQNDRKAVEELMVNLRKFDPIDPVKYDFALFGSGVNGFKTL